MGTTTSEMHGMKPTKKCNRCEDELVAEENWTMGNVRKKNYICKACDNAKRKVNLQKAKEETNSEEVEQDEAV